MNLLWSLPILTVPFRVVWNNQKRGRLVSAAGAFIAEKEMKSATLLRQYMISTEERGLPSRSSHDFFRVIDWSPRRWLDSCQRSSPASTPLAVACWCSERPWQSRNLPNGYSPT